MQVGSDIAGSLKSASLRILRAAALVWRPPGLPRYGVEVPLCDGRAGMAAVALAADSSAEGADLGADAAAEGASADPAAAAAPPSTVVAVGAAAEGGKAELSSSLENSTSSTSSSSSSSSSHTEWEPRGLFDRLGAELPPHAQPVFLRVVRSLSYTATFKHKKVRSARAARRGECSNGGPACVDPVRLFKEVTPRLTIS